jgi:NADH:ubiquinone oxidoreductase subunit 6 (subunit J)
MIVDSDAGLWLQVASLVLLVSMLGIGALAARHGEDHE